MPSYHSVLACDGLLALMDGLYQFVELSENVHIS